MELVGPHQGRPVWGVLPPPLGGCIAADSWACPDDSKDWKIYSAMSDKVNHFCRPHGYGHGRDHVPIQDLWSKFVPSQGAFLAKVDSASPHWQVDSSC